MRLRLGEFLRLGCEPIDCPEGRMASITWKRNDYLCIVRLCVARRWLDMMYV